jgi:hypothetical protein
MLRFLVLHAPHNVFSVTGSRVTDPIALVGRVQAFPAFHKIYTSKVPALRIGYVGLFAVPAFTWSSGVAGTGFELSIPTLAFCVSL